MLPAKLNNALVEFLKENYNVFAWLHGDMNGIVP